MRAEENNDRDENDAANLLSTSPRDSREKANTDLFMTIDRVREFDSQGAGLYQQMHGGNQVNFESEKDGTSVHYQTS